MKYTCLLILLYVVTISDAQNNKSIDFIGSLILNDGKIITYKVNFKSNDLSELIEGYSITDFYGENSTKSFIKGSYSSKNQLISFKETENLSTLSTSSKDLFCFIEVNKAKIRTVKGKSILQGEFKGVFKNGEICATGAIYMIGTDFLQDLNEQVSNSNRYKNDSTIAKLQTKYQPLLKNSGEFELKKNDKLAINWHSNECIFELWDGEKEDHDRVTIYVNNKKILENFTIKKEKKIIVIPFNENACAIKIEAENEGDYPPNTANIVLKDDSTYTSLVSNLKQGESTSIILTKQQQ